VAYEIYIPKADLTLIQLNPTEIRELDIDWFRYQLLDLQDDPAGRPWPRTHNHDTEATLGGLTYGRRFQIIDPYSVTFEDGQYAVNIVGGNSNILDKTNRNQVSIAPNNSAGLISTPLIEYSSFDDAVNIDLANITGRAKSGTIGVVGSRPIPVDNLADALLIEAVRGFGSFRVFGALPLTGQGYDVQQKLFLGIHPSLSSIDIGDPALTSGCIFHNLSVGGVLDGGNVLEDCTISDDLQYIEGTLLRCMLKAKIYLAGTSDTNLVNCYDGLPGLGLPEVDCGGAGRNLGVWGYRGGLKLSNKTGPESVSINLDVGRVVLDTNTITDGEILIKGVGLVEGGVSGTAVLDTSGLVNPASVAAASLEEALASHTTAGTLGKVVSELRGKHFGKWEIPSGTSQMVCYDEVGGVLVTFNLFKKDGQTPAVDGVDAAIRVPV